MNPRLSTDAHARYLIVPSAAACLIIVIVLFLVSLIPAALSTLAFLLLSAAVVAGFSARILLWLAHGIRRVELDGETMTILEGPALTPRRVPRRSFQRMTVTCRLGRHAATLFLRSGGRLCITSDAFPEEAFARMLAALEKWGK